MILVHRYDRLESDDVCAHDVHEHLTALHSSKYDFQLVALSYALPSGLQLWSLIFLALNTMVMLSRIVGTFYAVGCGLSAALALVWFLRITSRTSWNLNTQTFKSDKAENDMV
ncbi:hypothetical protein J3R30DRAFT_3419735 [Lentinula aciculospora]|uniref:Uncharacterized protein n=1 Tax=Lentinula aciculospora TaxID=153920 RepID=A0A9W9AW98_9AGAR|nr:hypothetical protein J3R30DRAFT_3419735 [Lentinula aciculospora]